MTTVMWPDSVGGKDGKEPQTTGLWIPELTHSTRSCLEDTDTQTGTSIWSNSEYLSYIFEEKQKHM